MPIILDSGQGKRKVIQMKKMYENIGSKLQAVAKFLGVLGIISIVLGIACVIFGIDYDEYLIGGLLAAVTGIMSIISSWPLYAFGQITNDIAAIREKTVSEE
jgi:hypothetical protein